jgi:hypothetical protein
MHGKELRELVKLTLLEFKGEEEKLRSWFEDVGDQKENELAKHGLTMVQSPKEYNVMTSVLGRGAYSSAYEVLYKGKHAVAKITRSRQDIEALVRLDALRDKLPENVAKHILKVYETFQLKDEDGNVYHVAIIEHLSPMPKSLENEYWGATWDVGQNLEDGITSGERISSLFKDHEKIANMLIDALSLVASIKKNVLNKKVINAIRRRIVNDTGLLEKFYNKTLNDFKNNNITQYVSNILVELNRGGAMFKEMPTPNKLDIATRHFVEMLTTASYGELFPMNMNDYKKRNIIKHTSEDKRVFDLWKALEYLKSRHNINWLDLHGKNVMVRPSTGDLVISDPGLFSF